MQIARSISQNLTNSDLESTLMAIKQYLQLIFIHEDAGKAHIIFSADSEPYNNLFFECR